jgi:hypothetical protein
MNDNLDLHDRITDLPEELRTVFFREPDPQWSTDEIQAAFNFVAESGSKPGVIWGGSVQLKKGSRLLRRKPQLRIGMNRTLFPFAKLQAEGTGRPYSRWNSPSYTKAIISNPDAIPAICDGTNIIDETGGDRSGKVVLLGIHKTGQLIVCTGGMPNDEIVAAQNPLVENFRRRQLDEFGMNIGEGSHRPAWWVQDGAMNHIIQYVTYKCTAEWVRDCFAARTSDAFEALVVVRDDPWAIEEVCAKYAAKGYKPWKWIVPLAQRDHSITV